MNTIRFVILLFILTSCEKDKHEPVVSQLGAPSIYFNGECGHDLWGPMYINNEDRGVYMYVIGSGRLLFNNTDKTYSLVCDYTFRNSAGEIIEKYYISETGTFSYTSIFHPAVIESRGSGFVRIISVAWWEGVITFYPTNSDSWSADYTISTVNETLGVELEKGTLIIRLNNCRK